MLPFLLLLFIPSVQVTQHVSIAHACPISKTEAITNRHVIGQGEPAAWRSPLDGSGGNLTILYADARFDIVVVKSDVPFPYWAPLSTQLPKRGDKVRMLGYDTDRLGKPPKEVEAKVTGYLAGQILFDASSGPGSSGGCVINSSGELVGIHWGAYGPSSARDNAAFSIFPPWWPIPERFRIWQRKEEE